MSRTPYIMRAIVVVALLLMAAAGAHALYTCRMSAAGLAVPILVREDAPCNLIPAELVIPLSQLWIQEEILNELRSLRQVLALNQSNTILH